MLDDAEDSGSYSASGVSVADHNLLHRGKNIINNFMYYKTSIMCSFPNLATTN